MTHIKIEKGLDIPIKGAPNGDVKPFKMNEIKQLALDLSSFEDIKFKLLVGLGDVVKIGQPLAEDKMTPGRYFVSPAGGILSEVRRGAKRRLLSLVIDKAEQEEFHQWKQMDVKSASREEIIQRMKEGGVFSHIHQRPFDLLADPSKKPRNIFVKAMESAPFTPPAEYQIIGNENEFQIGLTALSKITDGKVHLVYSAKSDLPAFREADNVEKHTAIGPHPISNYSLHIQKIDPIQSVDDVIYTLNVADVISIGHLIQNGLHYIFKVASLAGPGIYENKLGYYQVRKGIPIKVLTQNALKNEPLRLISGDPLNGHRVEESDFLGFDDFVVCAIPENESREFLHFFRLGKDKYSMSRAYLSGHLDNDKRQYDFTTSQHGEHRPFIVASLYDKVQPLNISTMLLTKAVMAEDFELAESLGLLEVAPEDFSLPTFVCPSKMEMSDIIHNGLKLYAKEVLA